MPEFEWEYRNMVNRLAFALLVFSCLFLIFSFVVTVLPFATDLMPEPFGEITYELAYGVLYAAVFSVPLIFFFLISRGRPTARMMLRFQLNGSVFLYLFAGIAVIHSAAFVNAYISDIFHFSSSVGPAAVDYTNRQLVLRLFVLSLVPAFVEELLFRGLVLSNLLPFGKTSAVVASAVLFGVMHQNVSQILYATVAGLVFGYVYIKSRSIWPCVMMHFFNNFLSVLQGALLARLERVTAIALISFLQGVIFLVGLICAIVLIGRQRKEALEKEQETAPDPDGALSFKRRVKLFFSPAMTAFFAVALLQTVAALVMDLLGNVLLGA